MTASVLARHAALMGIIFFKYVTNFCSKYKVQELAARTLVVVETTPGVLSVTEFLCNIKKYKRCPSGRFEKLYHVLRLFTWNTKRSSATHRISNLIYELILLYLY